MHLRRPAGVLLAMVLLTMGVASASSLGTFSDVAFSTFADKRTPCTHADVRLLDGPLDLITGTILPTSELSAVELADLTGDCVGTVPIVTVYGIDLTDLAAGEQHLFTVDQFGELTSTGDVTLTLTSPISLGDGLSTTLHDLTEARVGYCPGGRTCT